MNSVCVGMARQVLYLFGVLSLVFTACLAQCPVHCERAACPAIQENCPTTVVVDLCGCCMVCGRTEGEACGGDATAAVCAPGLACKISLEAGRILTGPEPGMCQDVNEVEDDSGAVHRVIDCDLVDCMEFPQPTCPNDSVLQMYHPPGQCCPLPPVCKCLPCLTSQMICKQGQIKVILSEGTGHPGQCCHKFECQPRESVCKNVSCEENGTEALFCPADSLALPAQATHSGCCLQHQGCECKPAEECALPQCDSDSSRRLVRKGTGLPGSCCNVYDCVADNRTVCYNQDVIRQDGERWVPSACVECTCQRGLTRCMREPCPHKPAPGCGLVGVPEGHCCPECKGCFDETSEFHALGVTWQQDACVTCTCSLEGRVYCQAEACAARCANPHRVPGICCPVCDDELSEVTLAPASCPSLASCSILCESGLAQDQQGCPVCACQEENAIDCEVECLNSFNDESSGESNCKCDGDHLVPPEACPSLICEFGYKQDPITDAKLCVCDLSPIHSGKKTCAMLDCEFGLKTDEEGDEICECREEGSVETLARCASVFRCNIECAYGYQQDEDDCLVCLCRPCSTLQCTKHCMHGHRLNDRGCPICKCLDSPQEPGLATSTQQPPPKPPATYCMSTEGHSVGDGQLWYDGCRRCFCNQGREMCAPVACPSPQCRHPVIRQGDCCPSCPDEDGSRQLPNEATECQTQEGIPLVEGETWQLDTCIQCICQQGEALCQVEHCPPLLCNHPVIIPGTCCAVCAEDIGFLPLDPDPYPQRMCESASGSLYTSGESWRVNACQSCACQNGRILCFSLTCPILTCAKTLVRKGQCCPSCLDTEYVAPQECRQRGAVYSLGESWLSSPCTQCICYQSQAVCAEVTCPLHQCPHPVRFPGHCCSVCQNGTESIKSLYNMDKADDKTKGPPAAETFSRHDIIIAVLATLSTTLILVVILLIVLLFCRGRYRHPRHSTSGQHEVSTHGNGDISNGRRPKSTNLDYQGINPLLPTQDMGKEGRMMGGIPSDPEKVPLDSPYVKIVSEG